MYKALNVLNIADYVRAGSFMTGSDLMAQEIGDGNINQVFRVTNNANNKSIIVKQALPYLKVVGKEWLLTKDRIKIEAKSLSIFGKYCTDKVPKVVYLDCDMSILIMEDLKGLHVFRKELIKMKKYQNTKHYLADYLAKNLFYHSSVYLNVKDKSKLIAEFQNPELCNITERLVFTEPYLKNSNNNYSDLLEERVIKLQSNRKLKLEVTLLKQNFLSNNQSLLHGDLHTGSIFVDNNVVKVFDTEFACFGPIGFDIGILLGNLILNYISIRIKLEVENTTCIDDYKGYLLNFIEDLYTQFEYNFAGLFDTKAKSDYSTIEGYREHYMRSIFCDTIGYSGCEIIRRIIGLAGVEEIDIINEKNIRFKVETYALDIGEYLITNRENFFCISDVIKFISKGNNQNRLENDSCY